MSTNASRSGGAPGSSGLAPNSPATHLRRSDAIPVEVLADQETTRVQALLPLRHSRMAVSPFTFYRGSAAVMAADLASLPSTGLVVQLCGDAHLSNFGLFAAPDRSLVFDINDFDETNPGPFEWDVYRLAVSFVLAGRDVQIEDDAIEFAVQTCANAYRTQMQKYAALPDLAVWYDRIGIDTLLEWVRADGRAPRPDRRPLRRGRRRRGPRDAWSAISKLTEVVDGQRRFVNQPPLIMRLSRSDVIAERIARSSRITRTRWRTTGNCCCPAIG